jgi:Tol biopolymer transport system component
VTDLFVKDRQTGAIERVNTDSGGNQSNDTVGPGPKISSNGRYITFVSSASDLVI